MWMIIKTNCPKRVISIPGGSGCADWYVSLVWGHDWLPNAMLFILLCSIELGLMHTNTKQGAHQGCDTSGEGRIRIKHRTGRYTHEHHSDCRAMNSTNQVSRYTGESPLNSYNHRHRACSIETLLWSNLSIKTYWLHSVHLDQRMLLRSITQHLYYLLTSQTFTSKYHGSPWFKIGLIKCRIRIWNERVHTNHPCISSAFASYCRTIVS
jgi:hypothetical protein